VLDREHRRILLFPFVCGPAGLRSLLDSDQGDSQGARLQSIRSIPERGGDPMTTRLTYRKHADLVARMAAVQGVDLAEAEMRGQLDADMLHSVILSCTACTDPEDCTHWLDADDEQVAGGTPDYCRNADVMARLRDLA
jgi:hypothetical protein